MHSVSRVGGLSIQFRGMASRLYRVSGSGLNKEAVLKEYWDKIFSGGHGLNDPSNRLKPSGHILTHAMQSLYQDCLSKGRKPTFVDLGSGSGEWITSLKRLCPESNCIGVDVSEQAIERSRQRSNIYCTNVTWMARSVTAFPWPNFPRIDGLVMDHILQYLSKDDQLSLLTNIKDRLAPGGIFICRTLLKEGNLYKSYERASSQLRGGVQLTFFDEEELKHMVSALSFNIIGSVRTNSTPMGLYGVKGDLDSLLLICQKDSEDGSMLKIPYSSPTFVRYITGVFNRQARSPEKVLIVGAMTNHAFDDVQRETESRLGDHFSRVPIDRFSRYLPSYGDSEYDIVLTSIQDNEESQFIEFFKSFSSGALQKSLLKALKQGGVLTVVINSKRELNFSREWVLSSLNSKPGQPNDVLLYSTGKIQEGYTLRVVIRKANLLLDMSPDIK